MVRYVRPLNESGTKTSEGSNPLPSAHCPHCGQCLQPNGVRHKCHIKKKAESKYNA